MMWNPYLFTINNTVNNKKHSKFSLMYLSSRHFCCSNHAFFDQFHQISWIPPLLTFLKILEFCTLSPRKENVWIVFIEWTEGKCCGWNPCLWLAVPAPRNHMINHMIAVGSLHHFTLSSDFSVILMVNKSPDLYSNVSGISAWLKFTCGETC